MKAINDNDSLISKLSKSILFLAICLMLMSPKAKADYYIFLQNKLGDDRAVINLFSQITTDTGTVLGNPGQLNSPLLPNKLLRLGKNINSNSLSILNLMVIEYQCIENPGSTDCWSYDPDFLSVPNGPLSCNFLQNITIDTADKLVSGSGTTGQATYETRQVRIVLNEDFTVSYRVIRRNTVTGKYARTEENMTIVNNGYACYLASI